MRSTCFGLGLSVLLSGGLFLFSQQVEIVPHQNLTAVTGWWTSLEAGEAVFHPPDWAAFSLLSIGGLMMLYAIGLPAPKPDRNEERSEPKLDRLDDPYYGRLTQSLIRVRATSSRAFPQQR